MYEEPAATHDWDHESYQVLAWARERSHDDAVVAAFWSHLCEAVNEPPDAAADRVLSELRAYGGNSIANAFRREGVHYAEVAWDVADKLAGWFGSPPCADGDLPATERYVLRCLEVDEDDLDAICAGLEARGVEDAVEDGLASATTKAAAAAAAWQAARFAARTAGEAAARKAAVEAGKRAAAKAAEKAAAEAAKRVFAQVLGALNVLLAAWLLVDLAGPAVRVTIPGVAFVAILRKLHAFSTED